MTEAVGSLAEEAAKLLNAAEEWWHEHVPQGEAQTAPECRFCPFCQVVAVVRNAQPDLVEHLADAASSLLLAVKSAMDAQERAWPRRRADAPVERIDVT